MSEESPKKLDPKVEAEVTRQLEILKFGVNEITPEEDFVKMLRHSIATNTPLRVKCGIDPTAADVHLGHTVPYRKMRQFQDLGHVGVVIIGDYTASIGDPTGKNESRPPLSREEIELNARRYMDQVYTVVDPDRTEVCFQSEWFKERDLKDVLSWAAQTTVAKLLSHDTFKDRLSEGHSLALHELFYPVLQGVDSVYVKADVELGGSDQRFNVLMGRDFQRNAGLRPQVAMLLPIVTGTCGTQKMSKSLGNYIGILDGPFDKFGKVMSIPDNIMGEYWKYLSGVSEEEYNEVVAGLEKGALHPNETKKDLAQKIVSFFHGADVGAQMRAKFEDVFKKGGVPEDAPTFEVSGEMEILPLLVDCKMVPSKSEGRRMITQGAVRFNDGDKIESIEFIISPSHKGQVLKIGKRKFLKLI